MKNITYVTNISQQQDADYSAYCITLYDVNLETMEFGHCNTEMLSIKQILNLSNVTKIASHTKPELFERVYPTDRKSPDMYKIPLYNILIPDLADVYELQRTRKASIFKNKNNSEPYYVFVENAGYTVLAKVYCLLHYRQTYGYNDTYYYDKQKNKSKEPIWFSTYQSANSTAKFISEKMYDQVDIKMHYIQML